MRPNGPTTFELGEVASQETKQGTYGLERRTCDHWCRLSSIKVSPGRMLCRCHKLYTDCFGIMTLICVFRRLVSLTRAVAHAIVYIFEQDVMSGRTWRSHHGDQIMAITSWRSHVGDSLHQMGDSLHQTHHMVLPW